MKQNNSPWIFELNTNRKSEILKSDLITDVAIVGAGIAGVSTAFFTLENTDKKVVLVDKYKLAHGATGHNAGHVAAYFEKPFQEIVNEYGLEMAAEGKRSIEMGWELIDHMYNTAELSIPFTRVLGYEGYANRYLVTQALEYSYLLCKGGLKYQNILIADDVEWLSEIDKKYDGFYGVAPRSEILKNVESKDDQYIACKGYNVGCVNSAKFCEEIIEYLLKKYKDRLSFYEHTSIHKVVLKKGGAILDAISNTITASRVVLCTNGFEHLEIFNESGLDIDTKFHHNVDGVIGYMSAYLEKMDKAPFAGCYYQNEKEDFNNPYFYVTRRGYDFLDKPSTNLICVGGPQFYLSHRKEYDRDAEYPEDSKEAIDKFVNQTYETNPSEKFEYEFNWHGLMGYTRTMLRIVGEEPKNNILMYNLGCNGVGILPSIFGGHRISKIIAGEKFAPTIFDPK